MQYSNTGQRVMANGDEDYRYTIRMYLVREKRPQYWEFKCCYCGTKVCELNGTLAYGSDLTHDSGKTMRHRCLGRDCRMWWEFVLN